MMIQNGRRLDVVRSWALCAIGLLAFLAAGGDLAAQARKQKPTPAESRQAENLVYNPSFEDYVECPRRIEATGQLTIVDGWYQPTGGSADYFNRCGSATCGVPRNKMGYQEPHSGDGYCGIYCSKTEYREYLQTELKEPLRAGCTYELSFYVSLSEYSVCAIATMGALLTPDRVADTARHILARQERRDMGYGMNQSITAYFAPQVQNAFEKPLADWRRWQRVYGTFKAEGGERFLTIGNFVTAAKSNITEPDSLSAELSGAYYYIDDVELRLIACSEVPADDAASLSKRDDGGNRRTSDPGTLSVQNLEKGSTLILRNIFFEFDKSVLLQQSYKELQTLLQLLSDNPSMKVLIIGHTDNLGGSSYNLRLSEKRAKAVVDYLVGKGIDQKRLQYKGRGSYEPIDTNLTEEGRANNRRVEMKVLSK